MFWGRKISQKKIGGYNSKNQYINEIIEVLNSQFSGVSDAFEYFLSQDTQLNQISHELSITGFKNAIEAILPKRFSTDDINFIWKKISLGANSVTSMKFAQVFDNHKYTGSKVNLPQK